MLFIDALLIPLNEIRKTLCLQQQGLLQSQALGICCLATQQGLIETTRFFNHAQGELLVHCFVIIAEFVLRLAIRSLVVAEPCPDLVNLSRELPAECNL